MNAVVTPTATTPTSATPETPAATPAITTPVTPEGAAPVEGTTPEVKVEEKPEGLRALAKKESKVRQQAKELETKEKSITDKEQTLSQKEQALAQREQVITQGKDAFLADPIGYAKKALGVETLTKEQATNLAMICWVEAGDAPPHVVAHVEKLRQENKMKRLDSLPTEEELLKKAQAQHEAKALEAEKKALLVSYQNTLVQHIETNLEQFPHINALAKADGERATHTLMKFAHWCASQQDERVNDPALLAAAFEEELKSEYSIYSSIYAPKIEEADPTAANTPPAAGTAKPPVAKPVTLSNTNTSTQPARGKQTKTEDERVAAAAALLRQGRTL